MSPVALESWVRDQLHLMRVTGPDDLEDIVEVSASPSGEVVACVVVLRPDVGTTSRRLGLLDPETGDLRIVELVHEVVGRVRWAPDGATLAVVLDDPQHGPVAAVITVEDEPRTLHTSEVPGAVEDCRWSPDGTRLGLLVALPGAEISDVYGSGTVGGADARESWRPRVWPGRAGGRELRVWDPLAGTSYAVTALNVWEFDWLGPASLVALASEGAGEGAWYAAEVWRLDLDAGVADRCTTRNTQLAQPQGARDGSAWSVLAGVASDRGLLAGDLLVTVGAAAPVTLDTAGVHVTDHRWLEDNRVLFIGHDGLETVVGIADPEGGAPVELWRGTESSGHHQPELAGMWRDSALLVLESHALPPTLGRVADQRFVPMLGCVGPGADHLIAQTGRTEHISWTSSDGTVIQGLLTTPANVAPPYALVLNVHGGPIAAWQDGWLGRDVHTTLLVARGYAVLRPNPRGSTGRGAAFAEAVVGDIGGLDTDDLITGAEHLIETGLADAARVGITGNSYGGYMAAWVTTRTDLFAAAVSRSPVTEWVTQHFTSNLAEFDELMLEGTPFDSESQYTTRSPLTFHERINTPILFTAGANDLATPANQAQLLHGALAERGVQTSLVIYPEEGHGVRAPGAVVDQCARMLAWFEQLMPPRPPVAAAGKHESSFSEITR